jgi:acetyl esterase/lipase
MGSSYFYLEFLIAWIKQLQDRRFKNPAVFALDYTLVPEGVWPQQFDETWAGYQLLLDFVGDPSRICVSGDSAGASLILSRLLHHGSHDEELVVYESRKPALAILISPWTHILSNLNENTRSDYLDARTLELYGTQYVGEHSAKNELISPGLSSGRWKTVMPSRGYGIVYGGEEVFVAGIEDTIRKIKADGARVKVKKEIGGIHAWPVVNLFLGRDRQERLRGINQMTDMVVSRMAKNVQILETPKRRTKEGPEGSEGSEHVSSYPSPQTPTPSKWSPLAYLG